MNYYWVCNGMAPALWTHSFILNFDCGNTNLVSSYIGPEGNGSYWKYQVQNVETFPVSGAEDDCLTYYLPDASTRFAILSQLPQTLTLSGEAPFMTTFSMPELYVYDGTATQVDTEIATSVSGDGSQATFPFPSTLQQNGYSVAVANQTNIGPGISTVGTNYLLIAQSTTIPGNPFGVSVGAQTVAYKCPWERSGPRGQSYSGVLTGTNYNTFPVVSLYSSNEVLISGTAVGVGQNPTAVVTYPSSSVTTSGTMIAGGVPCNATYTHSGNTRAVVANSGSNTVSVLDIVNNNLVFNVTVGKQPVALAVSSDGSTAYVANYTDGTVTQVNLISGTATAIVAVGGLPTSVALTAAGTLWVGGAGFLTELNANPMSVIATEQVPGKTIAALGFSNSVNQLVATTVDTSGNVYADEINPSTVREGGAYTSLASNLVSSVGTHLVQSAGVKAYTSTLANATMISPNQVGAPPLVVQDGWAVVTATPTGFTITDITGQVILVSETTPSPVTAIAVDSKLNVAYLVMPDSNTLLTVPLPGTN
jgi:YVTN family beta-propeller protein